MSTVDDWQKITDTVNNYLKPENKKVSLRQTKDRAKLLLKQHREDEKKSDKA
jgi:hypothetical protein